MATLNSVQLIGNLTRDPEQRAIPSGKTLATFGLAVNEKYKDGQGQAKEDTMFIDVTAWEKLGELATTYLKKGSPVLVVGRLRLETWDDKESGNKRSKHSVTAQNIQFLGKAPEKNGDGHPAQAAKPAPKNSDQATGEWEPPMQDLPF